MMRGAESRSRVVGALALIVFAALVLPAGAAAQSALEEYVLKLPGVERNGVDAAKPDLDPTRNAGPGGVTGERQPASAPITAVSSVASTGVVLALLTIVVGGAVLITLRRCRGGTG